MLKPKQESNNDKILKTLREIVSSGSNRQCFDCGQRGVTYVNMTIGSFVCTSCSGVLRGLTPPHRVKSISMATFTPDELEFVRTHGNDECAKTWLGLWDSKRTLKQDHRDFMIDKYERKRYYLEPASPLKSINTSSTSTSTLQQQSSATTNGIATKSNHSSDNLAVLKLTPPATNNRHHHRTNHHNELNGNGIHLYNGSSSSTNGSIKSDNNNDFVADFSKASIYNSNNSLNSTGSGGHVNGKITNGFGDTSVTTTNNSDVNANFADFDNNKIYNAAGLPMSTSSLSNNSLNSSSGTGTFNSNSSLNSTPSADRYAALKDLDEQLREAKALSEATTNEQNPPASTAIPVNPFKNPFQQQQQQHHHHQQQQQSYQNWTIPDSQSQFNGFGSPLNSNGFTNGFYYTNNMTQQPSPFNGKAVFSNPFMTTGSATAATTTGSSNNPFL
ncbi:hypothetical protein PVAND_004872 [Polypedilum vanderplanki]|uniref:Arf-GAP domain-containing protein n=1 Tax=Polypedilum vanderplanki TaxID=319348 RepID=A0A9J6BZ19_POLVA|nr:hypothetical protein PVAND_004872 [Polypedilum vanderplanki]